MEAGPLIAEGRDAQIFEYGTDAVLRRARDGRSLEFEARVMEFVHGTGFPSPRVHEVRGGGSEIVMERLEGPTMVRAMERAPWKVAKFGRILGELHHELHALTAPDWLPAHAVAGNEILHLDMHPLNVMLTS